MRLLLLLEDGESEIHGPVLLAVACLMLLLEMIRVASEDASCEWVYYDQEVKEREEEREKRDAAVVLNPQVERAMVGVLSEKES